MKYRTFLFAAMLGIAAVSRATVLTLNTALFNKGPLTRAEVVAAADAEVTTFENNAYKLSQNAIELRQKLGLWKKGIPFSLPVVVRLSSKTGGTGAGFGTGGGFNHYSAGPGGFGGGPGGGPRQLTSGPLTLQFDSSGSEAFPVAYQQLLQSVFNQAEPTLNLLFGNPAVGGVVHVANFDSTIGDRQAVAGGYYLPNNGAGMPEIRFPVYNANETAAVNFIHCLLLAYLGPDGYSSDSFEEGLVRAVTMKVVRTAGAMPSNLDPTAMENVLEADYDVLGFYDWDNQRALSAASFIAPNLISTPLPASGGTGLFLDRYIMAGSAWAKVLTEYPTFAANLNQQIYANPSLGSNIPGLVSAAQTILNTSRPSAPTVEGYPFVNWYDRQFVLQPTSVFGTRLFSQVLPISPTTGDFAVFDIAATLFSTDSSGNEKLLSSVTGYPIFWDDQYQRFTTSAQDAQMAFNNGDANVEPNLPDLYAGQEYRATLDVPVLDQVARVMVPADGAYTSSGTGNDFYGTTAGVTLNTGDTLNVTVSVGGTQIASFPVVNDAFGGTIGSLNGYDTGGLQITVSLVQQSGTTNTTLLTRTIDKPGPGALAVNMFVNSEQTYSYPNGLPGGISMVGIPDDPYTSDVAAILGTPANDTLVARYDPSTVNYDFYPDVEPFEAGHSYFVNLNTSIPNFALSGREQSGTSRCVALKPGWNMVSLPLLQSLQTTSVRVVHATDFPVDFATAEGTLIGKDFFFFAPGANDPIAGTPQGGTFKPSTTFDPGVGYFIEDLAPEGVTLVFDPGNTANIAHPLASQPSGWEMKAIFTTADGHSTEDILGGLIGATDVYNSSFDTPLPPVLGVGLQAASLNGPTRLFRDERSYGKWQNFTIQVQGLPVGKQFTLSFARDQGIIRYFTVTNNQTGQIQTCFINSQLTFTATAATETFTIRAIGF